MSVKLGKCTCGPQLVTQQYWNQREGLEDWRLGVMAMAGREAGCWSEGGGHVGKGRGWGKCTRWDRDERGTWARGWTKALCPLKKTPFNDLSWLPGYRPNYSQDPLPEGSVSSSLMQFYFPGRWIPLFVSPASSASGHHGCVKLLSTFSFSSGVPLSGKAASTRHLFFSISCPLILFLWVLTPVGNLLVLIWLMPPENGLWCPAPRRGLRFGQYWAHSK